MTSMATTSALFAERGAMRQALQAFAASVDRCLLLIRTDERVVWAWLGGRRAFEREEVAEVAASLRRELPPRTVFALGEPAEGLAGWRLTHRQAHAALPIARRSPETVVRYADVALLAAVLRDDLLATSLRKLYLEPLEAERDGGAVLRETLRAYFSRERNVSSAAMALGVSRQTVNSRLRSAAERLGRSLESCAVELHTALQLCALSERQVD